MYAFLYVSEKKTHTHAHMGSSSRKALRRFIFNSCSHSSLSRVSPHYVQCALHQICISFGTKYHEVAAHFPINSDPLMFIALDLIHHPKVSFFLLSLLCFSINRLFSLHMYKTASEREVGPWTSRKSIY